MRGDLSGVQQVKVVVRHLTPLNDPNLANNTTNAAGSVRIKTSGVNSIGRAFNDYDGDGKADLAVYLPAVPSAQPMQAGHQATPSAGSGQAGIWELFLSANGYQLVWGGFGGPEYQPVTE